jgi:acetylornithine deacetylase/succinyl-diaminopimelate desuccinylase-like protein
MNKDINLDTGKNLKTTKSLDFFNTQSQNHLKILKHLTEIPSVSFSGFDQGEVARCGEQVFKYFREIGLDNVKSIVIDDKDKPYIYGEWLKAPGKPTILLYGHYDVQPPGKMETWQSPPFELTERNGRLYARGSADDKGGLVASLAAVDSWLKSAGELPVNIKIIAEGEEECGSKGLDDFIAQYKNLIQADAIVIVDADNYDELTPGLTVSLRGMIATTIEIKTLRQPVHSGLLGGPLPDAAMALTKILATMTDSSGEIAIPEILEMATAIDEKERKTLSSLPFNLEKFRKESGILPQVPIRCKPENVLENLWFKPTLCITSMQAGSRAQAGNIIVDSAWARVGIRTVQNMDTQKVIKALKTHIEKNCPFGLVAEVKEEGSGSWWKTKTDHWAFQKMEQALQSGWQKMPVKIGCGASIPFVQTFTEALGGAPALLIGVCDPMTQAHSENESLNIEVWKKTVRSLISFIGSFD